MIDPTSLLSLLLSLIDLLTPNFIYSNGGNTTLDERKYEVCMAKETGIREKGLFPGIIIEHTHLQKEEKEDYWSMLNDKTEYYWNVYRRYPDGSTESFRVTADGSDKDLFDGS